VVGEVDLVDLELVLVCFEVDVEEKEPD